MCNLGNAFGAMQHVPCVNVKGAPSAIDTNSRRSSRRQRPGNIDRGGVEDRLSP
jgi:hypothetical protein